MSLFNFIACCFPSRPKYYNWLKNQNVSLLDMPDLVTIEILKNLDFLSICKLRGVCHALRDSIDCLKPDSNLRLIGLQLRADLIFGCVGVQESTPPLLSNRVKFDDKEIQFDYNEMNDECVVITCNQKSHFQKNFVDMCIDELLWPALKHQKSLLGHLYVTKNVFDEHLNRVSQTAGKFVVPTFDKVFNGLMKVLESRDRLLQVESLTISLHGQEQLMQLLRHVDLKVLKRLAVSRLLETESISEYSEDNNEFVLDLDILKDCRNLRSLRVKRFSICTSFRIFAHIPILSVNMQTIYCEDVLRFIQTMENSNIHADSEIRFQQFPDKSRFLETIGLAEDGGRPAHVFPSKLSLTFYHRSRIMYFSWEDTS